MKTISDCCKAEIKTDCADEGTCCFICTACDKPCDIIRVKKFSRKVIKIPYQKTSLDIWLWMIGISFFICLYWWISMLAILINRPSMIELVRVPSQFEMFYKDCYTKGGYYEVIYSQSAEQFAVKCNDEFRPFNLK
jgi:hypothetical protein